MFKVGDRVRIKSDLSEIIEQRRRSREWHAEIGTMVERYAGEEGVITQMDSKTCELSTNIYTWGLYAIEPVDMNVIKYHVIL